MYRTRELAKWSANATRLAMRLVRDGELVRLGQGLFAAPKVSRFGNVPPSDSELLRSFLDGAPFVVTGPERWNALGLGTTATFATPLVYNTKRSGRFELGRRAFVLRRVAFPERPPAEWFVIDLFEHAEQAAADRTSLQASLARALRAKRFDRDGLAAMAERFGSRRTRALVQGALEASR